MAPQAGFEPATLRLTVASRGAGTESYGVVCSNTRGLRLAISSFHHFVLSQFTFRREWAQKGAHFLRRQMRGFTTTARKITCSVRESYDRRRVLRHYSLQVFIRPPSQTWRTFLANHVSALASMDFFTVHTLTGRVLRARRALASPAPDSARELHRAPEIRVDGPAVRGDVLRESCIR